MNSNTQIRENLKAITRQYLKGRYRIPENVVVRDKGKSKHWRTKKTLLHFVASIEIFAPNTLYDPDNNDCIVSDLSTDEGEWVPAEVLITTTLQGAVCGCFVANVGK